MEQLAELVWLVPLFPLVGFLTLMVVGRRIGEPGAGWLATLAMGGSFAASVLVFVGLLARDEYGTDRIVEVTLFDWVPAGELHVSFGLLADPLSVAMILFITGVATLIHLYSIGYMHGDENFSKFFIYLNMFAFSMLLLVLGDNLLLTFLGWEGVGACSYFLISFWFSDEANSSAGKKAFVTNRVGDFGFMLATFLAFFTFGSINYSEMLSGSISTTTATAISLLLLVGAAGKSAQFPLYLWLPDAMAGPTPVSALIHAATMVTSGIYLLTRMNPIIAAADSWVPDVIAWVGLFTALFAATIAVAQNDIKKVLAYSTVSQLGFMFVGVGAGLYVAAIFHMITHAFFKALLFLGSGSVIHGMSNDQDMRNYGALRKLMPVTSLTFIIGWLAIAGVPPFSGFWSKDEVLLGAWNTNKVLWFLLLIAAVMTAFYMTRLVIMTFFGEARWTDEAHAEHAAAAVDAATDEAIEADTEAAADGALDTAPVHTLPHRHPHESPWQMTLPLVVLAGLAAVAGVLNLPFASSTKFLEHWLEPILFGNEVHVTAGGGTKWILAIIAIIGATLGLLAAAAVYLRRQVDPDAIEQPILANGWGYDAAVTSFMGGPGRALFDTITNFDRTVIDGAVNGVARAVRGVGAGVRGAQTGFVRSYALGIGAGAVALMIYFLVRTL